MERSQSYNWCTIRATFGSISHIGSPTSHVRRGWAKCWFECTEIQCSNSFTFISLMHDQTMSLRETLSSLLGVWMEGFTDYLLLTKSVATVLQRVLWHLSTYIAANHSCGVESCFLNIPHTYIGQLQGDSTRQPIYLLRFPYLSMKEHSSMNEHPCLWFALTHHQLQHPSPFHKRIRCPWLLFCNTTV